MKRINLDGMMIAKRAISKLLTVVASANIGLLLATEWRAVCGGGGGSSVKD